jgi:hypothetical protein
MDWVVLLTPLLVLGIVLLLGFAGCSFEARVASTLTLRARVPSALSVTRVTFRWTGPGEDGEQVLPDPTPVRTEGGDNVFEHEVYYSASGGWMTTCQVRVREGTMVAADEAPGDFIDDGSISEPIAVYQASGSPSTGNFAVIFAGLLEGAMA